MDWLRLVDPSNAEDEGYECSDEESADNEGADSHMEYVPPVRVREAIEDGRVKSEACGGFFCHEQRFTGSLPAFPRLPSPRKSNEMVGRSCSSVREALVGSLGLRRVTWRSRAHLQSLTRQGGSIEAGAAYLRRSAAIASCFQMQPRRIERDRRCIRDI